ncbi:ABC transporter permease [Streptomyces triticirhizae]|uniref:Transport permease protein n=2 Tax=Streptomyces triticirhizae TaxID=2483353 RepID=A0A3M2LYF0_9ACTN|nr:ABC transporter permease [Streptomyces triticirhizae]RMI42367.1 ABC transporter permease [Streptomyces triticirhizae]
MSTMRSERTERLAPSAAGGASVRRMRSLARAELTLLLRSRTALWVALLMPLLMVLATYSALEELDLSEAGLTQGEAVLTGGVGMVLLVVIYLNLVPALVTRREERVLKRLRTGEIADREILMGAALPTVTVAVAQSLVLVVAGTVLLDVSAPGSPALLLAGIGLAVVTLVLLAVVTAGLTRTVDSAQITTTPLLLVCAVGCGIFIPLEIFPESVTWACRMLPLTGSVELIRHGWIGGLDGVEIARAGLFALAWVVIGVFAVRRWFRWDPRQ